MGCSEELSDFKRGTVIGCHLCNKTVREMSWLLNIPRSTVSDIIRKWKRLGTTATQPRSGRQRKITERGQRLLRHMVHKSGQRSADSIAKGFRASTGINVSTKTAPGASWNGFPWPSSCMQASCHQVQCQVSDGLWSSRNMFCGVTNHASLFGSQMGESGFGGCRENVTCLTALCQL